SRIPLELNNNGFGIFLEGHQSSAEDAPYRLDGARIDEGYFGTLGLGMIAGRGIEAADREPGAVPVAVVNETLAARWWPGEDALGRELRTSWDGPPIRVVGVV